MKILLSIGCHTSPAAMIFLFIQVSFSCSFHPLTATLALEVHFKSSKNFKGLLQEYDFTYPQPPFPC